MSASGKAKILVVDDLAERILVYRVILEELQQEVHAANGGAEALAQVLQHDFAVILLDVNMPDMDGFETASMIRARTRSAHTPIIFVTADTDQIRMVDGYAHGGVDYILTPIVPEILRAKVKVFVDLFLMNQQVKQQAEQRIALAEERMKRSSAEEANRRLSFLARAGAVLGQSLDLEVTARDVVKITVPALADRAILARPINAAARWGVIQAIRSPDAVALTEFTGLDSLPIHLAEAIERVFESGREERIGAGGGQSADAGPIVGILPLQARGQTFGVLALSREESGRQFGAADLTMVDAFVTRASFVIDNTHLFRDLERADRQKNEFLSMLAHELRNPLAPIRNAVAVLRQGDRTAESSRWAEDVIDRQVTHLVRLVDDLLDVSRITSGKIRLEWQRVGIAEVVNSAIETSRPLIEANGHQLRVDFPSESLWVRADQARLSHVLSNLLNNAAKYTPSRGMIGVAVAREESDAVIRVTDTGIGIPQDMLGRIFDLFAQVDQSLDRSQGGLGIGLTLVRRLVQMHGGDVYAHSAGLGQGSEFTIRLPLQTEAPVPETPAPCPAVAAVRGDGRRVLVVDDNRDAADSLAKLLRITGGFSLRTAYDGPTALETAAQFKPHVCILDLGLPGMNGYDVARELRSWSEGPEMLLLALSGYGREEDRAKSKAAGFDFHFSKPVAIAALLGYLAKTKPAQTQALQLSK